jgi:hypothetical protein
MALSRSDHKWIYLDRISPNQLNARELSTACSRTRHQLTLRTRSQLRRRWRGQTSPGLCPQKSRHFVSHGSRESIISTRLHHLQNWRPKAGGLLFSRAYDSRCCAWIPRYYVTSCLAGLKTSVEVLHNYDRSQVHNLTDHEIKKSTRNSQS